MVEAISCQGNGDVTGSLQLNHNLLTSTFFVTEFKTKLGERFSNLGSFVHPKHYILPMLTVRSLLYYTGSLYLGGLTTITDIHKRVRIYSFSKNRMFRLAV